MGLRSIGGYKATDGRITAVMEMPHKHFVFGVQCAGYKVDMFFSQTNSLFGFAVVCFIIYLLTLSVLLYHP